MTRSKLLLVCTLSLNGVVGCSETVATADQKPEAIELLEAVTEAVVGDTVPVAVRVTDRTGKPVSGVEVSWSTAANSGIFPFDHSITNNEGVAQASWRLGTVPGTQRSTVSVAGVEPLMVSVDVSPGAPSSLDIEPDTLRFVALYETAGLAVTVEDAHGNSIANAQVTWSSSDPLIATIAPDGLAEATGNGRALLVAVTSGLADTAIADVRQVPVDVDIAGVPDSLLVGGSVSLTAGAADANGHAVPDAIISWSTSNSAVASVTQEGLVSGEGAGMAKIMAAVENAADTVSIVVQKPRLSKLAFVSDFDGDRDIYVGYPDSSGIQQLTNDPNSDEFPTWSPDGAQIAFVSDRSGSREIWVMDADGTNETQLTSFSGSTPPYSLDWSPDGTTILFGAQNRIWRVSVAGGPAEQVSTEAVEWDGTPKWSPDGTAIAFSRRTGEEAAGEVWTMKADGSEQVQLTSNESVEPDWAPDGSSILFVWNVTTDNHGLYTMQVDGRNKTPVSTIDGRSPEWSPDGSLIATLVRTGTYDVWILDSNGSLLWKLDGLQAAWKPETAP